MTAMCDLKDIPPREIWGGVLARLIGADGLTLAVVEIPPGRGCPGTSTRTCSLAS